MAAGQNRLRGKETQMVIYSNGVRLTGDFLLVKSWTITPDQEIKSEQFTGEKRARNDLNVRGFDGNITVQLANHVAVELADSINRQEKLGLPNPTYQIILTMAYRESRFRSITLEDEVVLSMPTLEGNEDDYVTAAFDLRSRNMATA